jgi:HSP20 family protein
MPKKGKKELLKPEPSRVLSPLGEAERWFDESFWKPFSLMSARWLPRFRTGEIGEISPSIDMFTEKDDVVVKAELPGMKKEDINVSLTDNTITVSGEKKQEEKVEKKDYYSYERSYGSFSRSIRLPAEVHTDKASAKFKDGVLEIRIPKTEEAKKKEKKVAIQ